MIPLRDEQQPAAAETGASGSTSHELTPARGALSAAVASERAPQLSTPGTSDASTSVLDSVSGPENGATQLNLTVPLPVALPSSAMLGGVLITVRPEGVARPELMRSLTRYWCAPSSGVQTWAKTPRFGTLPNWCWRISW